MSKNIDLQVSVTYRCLDCGGTGVGEAWWQHALAGRCAKSRIITTVSTVHGTLLGEFEEVDGQPTTAPDR